MLGSKGNTKIMEVGAVSNGKRSLADLRVPSLDCICDESEEDVDAELSKIFSMMTTNIISSPPSPPTPPSLMPKRITKTMKKSMTGLPIFISFNPGPRSCASDSFWVPACMQSPAPEIKAEHTNNKA